MHFFHFIKLKLTHVETGQNVYVLKEKRDFRDNLDPRKFSTIWSKCVYASVYTRIEVAKYNDFYVSTTDLARCQTNDIAVEKSNRKLDYTDCTTFVVHILHKESVYAKNQLTRYRFRSRVLPGKDACC